MKLLPFALALALLVPTMADRKRIFSSPSPPASLGSDAMSESASPPEQAPASPVDDGPMYPLEGKFTSAADRAHIMSLPEIDREALLAERASENLKRQQDLQLRKALAATQAAASKHKRKAAAAHLDDDGGARKSKREKADRTGRSALDDYKKAREAKGAERTGRFDTKPGRRRDSRSPSSASDRDAEGESEVEWATEPVRREEPADLRDFERCRVGRSNFAKVCFYPNFEATMKGCFCRVSIGVNRETGQNMYRMTQIKGEISYLVTILGDALLLIRHSGFKPGRSYSLELPNGKTFTTDQYAVVAHGNAEKPWPFSACSDSRFSQEEFNRYLDTLQKEHLRIPKKAWLVQKLDDIHKFLNVEWTDVVLQGKFSRQREMERRVDPAHAAKIKKENILKRKTEAEDLGDMEEVSRCEAELAALENNAATANTNGSPSSGHSTTINTLKNTTSPSKPKPIPGTSIATSTQERLALLNQKNRGKNADDVRKALLEERRKLHRERERALAEAKAKAEADAEAARLSAEGGMLGVPGRSDMRDLFGDLSDFSRAGTPVSGVSTPRMRRSRAGTPMNGVGGGGPGGEKKKSALGFGALGGGKKKGGDEDELGGLDLGVDVEI